MTFAPRPDLTGRATGPAEQITAGGQVSDERLTLPQPNKVSTNERFGSEPVGRGGSVMSSVIRGSGWVY